MASPAFYTARMVRTLPDDGNRYETVRGELLVTPAPRPLHQVVLQRLLIELSRYLDREPLGFVLASPADISWGRDTLVQPDLFVVDIDEARTLDWRRMKTLLLAVEVISPGTARADRFTKRRLYQEVGVPTYWIVDPDRREVEIWTPGASFPELGRDGLSWRPAGANAGFTIELADLFRPV